ncbi:MFS transporter, partial [Escherichia coli]|nr:MFS transporter [Escherichia coli]
VGLSATNSGLTVTPLTFGIVFGNVISGQLVSRFGRYKPLMLAGIVVLAAAFIIMGFTLTPQSTQAEVTLKMILMGLGLG